ncbi:MAG: primosomal protein N' [Flavobacteriales bacterium]
MFAEIILPVAAPGTFTYAVPDEHATAVRPGVRVVVGFGRGRKLYSGIVRRVHQEDPGLPGIRPVLSVLDRSPIVRDEQLRLWDAIATHYMCTLGEVMLAALPGSLVLSSETRLVAASDRPEQWTGDGRQDVLLDALERRGELDLGQAGELLGLKDPMPVIRDLLDRGLLMVAEEIADQTAPRMDRFVRLAPEASREEALHAWFDRLEKAPRLLALLMRFVELGRVLSDDPLEVRRDQLLRTAGATAAHLRKLVEKGLFEEYERPAGMPALVGGVPGKVLSAPQQEALGGLHEALARKPVVLLQGVTASGKTELYMALIAGALAEGRSALYLLPEIALTTQVIARLRERFGEGVRVYHSRLNPRERMELWMDMLRAPDTPRLVVGARSAIFLPFHKLGVQVVDEEHDPSYKQQDPAPRYNARDMAVVLGGIHGAGVVLGSATPSMESRYNAEQGRYGHVRLLERHGDARLPRIERIDLVEERKRKRMRGDFSEALLTAIERARSRGEQSIVFQNRRGYVPVWQCGTCGWIPGCEHCDVSLTYHKNGHELRCHYCGRAYPPPVRCASCGSNRLRMLGMGTEKIEEELGALLPEARIVRLDQDTTRGKHAMERILDRFGRGEVDVLVGTQMVAKGLDFDQVTVVGIINADQLLRYPDLRAHERAFQLMSQVAGRSGRKRDPGTVYIQANDIHHPVIGLVVDHDVDGMYRRELEHRRAHVYPPFTRLIRLVLKHRDEQRVRDAADALGQALRARLGDRVLGPEPPPVARVRDKHLRALLIKLQRSDYAAGKAASRDAIDQVFAMDQHRSVQLVIDVDPG